jgi:hypothetical protein
MFNYIFLNIDILNIPNKKKYTEQNRIYNQNLAAYQAWMSAEQMENKRRQQQ